MNPPKYSLPEIERRWLVEPERMPELAGENTSIVDRYLIGGRLRLRKVIDGAGVHYKLCKKYNGGQIANLYLDEHEYDSLANIPACQVFKQRYRFKYGAIDLYENDKDKLAVFEVEYESCEEAERYLPPTFAGEEVTGKEEYSGFELAKRFRSSP